MPSRPFRVGRSATGLGLFATKLIKRAAYIATYRGRRISSDEAYWREQRGAKYMFELNKRWVIDGSPRWNVARYINHSCRPNAEPMIGKGRIWFKALRSIEPGEEITYNYGPEYFDFFLDNGGCRCVPCLKKKARARRTNRATSSSVPSKVRRASKTSK
jgi:SET domain-containing protein